MSFYNVLVMTNHDHCFLRLVVIVDCFVKPFNSSRFMLSFVFFFVLRFETVRTYKEHNFFNSFVAARSSRVLKIYVKNPKNVR